MTTITITTPPNHTFDPITLQSIIQGDIEVHEIVEREAALSFPQNASHTHVHLLAQPYGLTQQEIKTLLEDFSYRFASAEFLLDAHAVFSQSFVGQHNNTIHIFVSHNKNTLANLASLLKQIPHDLPSISSPTSSEQAAPLKENATLVKGISLEQTPSSEEPKEKELVHSWQEALQQLGGTLDEASWVPINLQKPPAVRNVLEKANSRAKVLFSNGKEYTLYGYPNLEHRNSKVLLVGTEGSHIEILALHRAPQKVGVFSRFGLDWLPKVDSDIQEFCKKETGRKAPRENITLFAIDRTCIYYEQNGTVYQWDGKKERNFGSPNQSLASLLLQWSQR